MSEEATSERPFRVASVNVRINLQIPEEVVDRIVSPGDEYEAGLIAVEEWVKDNLPDALGSHASGEAEVEASA